MALGHGTSIVRDGLVLHLDAANKKSYPATGTVWTDLSGNVNLGTLTNGPTYSSTNSGSIAFDGVDDNVTFSKTWGDVKGSNWSGYITMEGFLKTPTSPTNSALGYFGFSSPSAYFKIMNTSYLFSDAYSSAAVRVITKLSENTSYNGNWIHVCVVYDGTIKTYSNGSLLYTSTPFTLADISALNFSIGAGMGYYNLQGDVSSVKLYNRALTAAEVSQNFNALRGRFGV